MQGIPGVKEHACFLKEIGDSAKIRKTVMDCIESAMFKEQTPEEKERLLHMVKIRYSDACGISLTIFRSLLVVVPLAWNLLRSSTTSSKRT